MSSPSITVPEVPTHKAISESPVDETRDMPWESGFGTRESHRNRILCRALRGHHGMANSSPRSVARSHVNSGPGKEIAQRTSSWSLSCRRKSVGLIALDERMEYIRKTDIPRCPEPSAQTQQSTDPSKQSPTIFPLYLPLFLCLCFLFCLWSILFLPFSEA